MRAADRTPTAISAWHRRWRRVLATGALRLLLLCAVGGTLIGGVAWLAGSESGLRWLGSTLVAASGGRLQIDGVGGRLLGDWHAQSLHWSQGEQRVGVEQLVVSASPAALLRGELAFARISAERVSLTLTASQEPALLPASLRLPFAVSVEALYIGRLTLGGEPAAGVTLAESVSARLQSDGRTHRIEGLRAKLGRLAVHADATLAGDAPYALNVAAQLQVGEACGERCQPAVSLALVADGTLQRVRVSGRLGDEPAAAAPMAKGDIELLVTPFAASTIESLRAQLSAIDPALFTDHAPHALIDVDLVLAQSPSPTADAGELAGQLRVHNRSVGSVDRDRLPLQSLSSRIAWRGDALRLDAIELAVAGGGSLRGSARASLALSALAVDLTAQRVDARAVDARLPATLLAGPLRAHLAIARQRVEVDWRDTRASPDSHGSTSSRFIVRATASADAQAVEIERLQLGSAGAGVTLQGRLEMAGARSFQASGEVRDVDVAVFASLLGVAGAHSKIRGDFSVRGALAAQPRMALRFSLGGSLGGQPLAGRGEIDWGDGRLRRGEVEVQAAGNRLLVAGALAQRGDRLRLSLAAPRLGALGWPGLTGDLAASAEIAGGATLADLARQASVQASIAASRLRLGEVFEAAGLTLEARLGAGANGTLSLDARCTPCRSARHGVAPLMLALSAEGDRRQQRWQVRLDLPRQRELRLAANGGFAVEGSVGQAAPVWRGTLSALRLADAPAPAAAWIELSAPAAFNVGDQVLSLGTADFAGRLGRFSIDRLDYAAGRWRSAGRWQQLDAAALLAGLADFEKVRSWRQGLDKVGLDGLRLAGEWAFQDLAIALPLPGVPALRPAARFAVWRERGDLRLGDLPLGLETARLQASLTDAGLAFNASVRTARYGEARAELALDPAATTGTAAPGPLLGRDTPWHGSLHADLTDLSWLVPLLGDGWQVAGQLHGQMLLAGSAARPQLSGQWRGERLALRALDLGLRLADGDAELEITPQRLLLRRLRLTSEYLPLPAALKSSGRVDAARLTATPGVIEASGELPLTDGGSPARLAIHFDRLAVVQRADQWAAVSGDAEVAISERLLAVNGKLRADAAFWALAAVDRPRLADDVVLRGVPGESQGGRLARAFKVDLAIDLGNQAYFRGAGVDSRLAGELRLRSDDAGLPRATGTIRTVDGRFDAYGQKLEIERGIVNFQGAIDNPGLNLLAVRKNQQVEAGVEVGGTAQRPKITLVSTPNVPDAEKLSWLVLGRSLEQQGGDGALLFAAAQTLMGGQDGGALRQLQRALGIDEFGVANGQIGGLSSAPTSRVASSSGFGASSQTVNGQIVSVGKRLADNAVLSYQQSLNTTESIVKLTVNLNRQFSVVGSAGSDSAIDFFWRFSFGR